MGFKFVCECEDGECREEIPLEFEEVIFLRRHNGFVVLPGHEGPNDTVIGWDSDNRFVYVVEQEVTV